MFHDKFYVALTSEFQEILDQLIKEEGSAQAAGSGSTGPSVTSAGGSNPGFNAQAAKLGNFEFQTYIFKAAVGQAYKSEGKKYDRLQKKQRGTQGSTSAQKLEYNNDTQSEKNISEKMSPPPPVPRIKRKLSADQESGVYIFNRFGEEKVDAAATLDEIKVAYRRLAKTHHPDCNKSPQASDDFKLIAWAYKKLIAGF